MLASPCRTGQREGHNPIMATFEWIIVLLLGAALLAALASSSPQSARRCRRSRELGAGGGTQDRS
jgi:hypothetical protein